MLSFLKGKTSNFVSNLRCLIRPCLGKIIFLLVRVCSSLDEIYTLMLILSEPWIFFYFCSIISFFFSLNIVFILVGFSFFFVVFVGGVLCVFIHLLVSCSVYFGRSGSLGVFWRAGSYFPSVWGSALWSVGPVLFIWLLAWGGWRGCTGFSSRGLC